ncbi:MAG: hypothetical protein CM1200mP13_17680 [Candidatus Pelagibacterales bacterium]|nr:MAG: hypothetical protein CM1200mP13_17680 [Pelagibacterales bacterium]
MKKLKKHIYGLIALFAFIPFNYSYALPPLASGSDWLRDWSGTNLVLTSHTGPTTDAAKVLQKNLKKLPVLPLKLKDESWTGLLAKHQAD